MTHYNNSIALRQKLIKSNGYKLTNKMNQFYLTTYIFNENFIELSKHLEKQAEPFNAFRLAHKENREELYSLQLETNRFLHNYIVSAISLIDHTRIFVRDLYTENKPFFDEYQNEVTKKFIENPLAVFIKSFRQYAQHFQSPMIVTVSSLADNPADMKAKVVIEKESLLQFSGWKAPAKEFIDRIDKELDIKILTKDYHELVSNFYKWFQTRQREIHKDDFNQLDSIQKEIKIARLTELVFQFIDSDDIKKDYFKNEFRNYMGTVEIKYFDNASLEQQLHFLISAIKINNIVISSQEEDTIRKKYSR